MLYYLCSRCQFRVPANKHVCPTCGNKLPAPQKSSEAEKQAPATKTSMWARFLGLDAGKQQEQEKPALSES